MWNNDTMAVFFYIPGIIWIVMVVLEFFVAKKSKKWGKVFPIVSLAWSFVYVFHIPLWVMANPVLQVLANLALGNIPTYILLAVYFVGRYIKKKELIKIEKTYITDL
jgi:hypothetical protein